MNNLNIYTHSSLAAHDFVYYIRIFLVLVFDPLSQLDECEPLFHILTNFLLIIIPCCQLHHAIYVVVHRDIHYSGLFGAAQIGRLKKVFLKVCKYNVLEYSAFFCNRLFLVITWG